MKNQIVFLFLLLFTFACNKSEEPTMTLQEQVIGEWQIHSFVINSCPDASENLPLTLADEEGCLDVMGDTSCMSILIMENGQAEVRDGDSRESEGSEKLTYEIDETNNTINLCDGLEDCLTFSLRDGGLYNEMDEEGCICVLGFKKM